MPLGRGTPAPYDFKLGDHAYLYPPPRFMQAIGQHPYTRDPLPWFPPRQQQAAVSESLFPPQSEVDITVRDRSHGFGWSDPPDEGDPHTYAYTDSVDADGQGVDCSTEGVACLGPLINTVTMTGGDGAMSGHFELTVLGTRYVYVVFGTKMFRSSDGTTFSAVQASGSDLPGPLTGRPAVFRGAQATDLVYLPLGASTPFRVWDGNPATAFGLGTTTDNNKVIDFAQKDDFVGAIWLDTVAATQAYRFSKFFDGIPAAATTNPTWTISIAVSDRTDAAQYLMLSHGRLYIGCNRSLRSLADDAASLKEVVWTTQAAADNFRWWTSWREELWFNGYQGSYRVMPLDGRIAFDQPGPERLPNNRTPVRGVIRAKAGDDYCLYSFLRTEAGVTYLLKHRYYDTPEGGRRAAFHPISKIGTFDVNYAAVSNVHATNPVLYFGRTSTSLGYVILPRNGFYPPNDPNYKFCTKGYLFDSRQWGGMYFVSKLLMAWTGRGESLTGTEKLTAHYRDAIGGAYTQFGTVSLDGDPGTRLDLTTLAVVSWWEGRITFERGATETNTPKLLAGTYAFALRPIAKGHFTLYAWLADYAAVRSGIADRRSAADLERALTNLDSLTTPITLTNKRGLQYEILVDEVRIVELETDEASGPLAAARITATEWQSLGSGTHNTLDRYTHDELDLYTHDQLALLL